MTTCTPCVCELPTRNVIQIDKVHPSVAFEAAVKFFELDRSMLLSRSRRKEYITARHAVRWFCRFSLGMAVLSIGYYTGSDHSTVVHSCQTIEDICSVDADFRNRIMAFKEYAEMYCQANRRKRFRLSEYGVLDRREVRQLYNLSKYE